MTNKGARELLETIYGKGCMFYKANILEKLKGTNIKGYKQFVGEQHYKSKKIHRLERTLTLHHLIHQSEGGETTLENGAVINELAHRYMHSLPREQEEVINNMLRDYKDSFDIRGGILIPTETGFQTIDPFVVPNLEDEEDFISIALEDMTPEIREKRFNRAKEKRETRKLADEELFKYYKDIERDNEI